MTTAADVLESRREAVALRRYVREQAAGRAAPEWVIYDDRLGAWLSTSEAQATGGGRDWRRVRQPGEPWCSTLGRDLTIATDDSLQAVFATIGEDDPGAWRRLFLDVDRAPARCLSDWRARGRRLLAAVSGDPVATGGNLAGRFAARGTGKRSLAGV
ncbi:MULTISPECIES: hypothetical protein [Aureimonas]|jgi:hypothetical protein|uniref:Uncharacterized protein n=1 Tax=Aureimonas flava TaxID=2320271 RepID=A0A3A1WG54_9HYPH|nr:MULTISPECIES: hypothetical protein [Aureimonas]RIX99127.1 hypothetical protein D3218_15240 [Aureimonas flava]